MAKKNNELQEKILDVDASMQGTISFKDPVNLRINGSFEGKLDTRGNLTIGENAKVTANINGDNIVIAVDHRGCFCVKSFHPCAGDHPEYPHAPAEHYGRSGS